MAASTTTNPASTPPTKPTTAQPVSTILAFVRPRLTTLSLTALFLAIVMYAFLRSPLTHWQHALLQHTVPAQQPVDAIVVLGYAVDHDAGVVTAPLAARLEQAYQLLRRNVSSSVVFTGGCSWSKRDELPSEAAVMARWMEARWKGKPLPQTADSPALPPSSTSTDLPTFILEEHSTSTRTNALFTFRLLAEHHPHVQSLLLVTSRFHQWRTYAVFARAVREYAGGGRESGEGSSGGGGSGGAWSVGVSGMERDVMDDRVTQWDFWRELAAIVYYKLRGYI